MKKYSKVLCLVATTLTIISSSIPVFATTTKVQKPVVPIVEVTNSGAISAKEIKDAQQGIFNQATTDAEWAKAKKKPVTPDKVSSVSSSTKGITTAAAYGSYPTRNGVILVTADSFYGIPLGHAAIIWTANTVVEALSSGVTTGPNNWATAKQTCYGVTTYGTTLSQDNAASNECYYKYGSPYNYNYFNPYTRSSFYCSQLIYAAFLDLYGIDLNTSAYGVAIKPTELVNNPKTHTVYQK